MSILKCISTCFLLAVPANLLAQQVTSSTKTASNPRLKRTTIEVRPFESLLSATPGIASGGGVIETYLGRNWAVNASGTYIDAKLPTKTVRTVNDKTNQPMVKNGYGFAVGGGLRYYDYPIGDSLYGGLDVDYSEAHFGWEFEEENYKTHRYAVTPGLVAGYRWVWTNGFLARLGAGAGLPSVSSQSIKTETNGEDASEGQKKIEDILDQQVVAKVDLGLGMMF